MDYENTSLCKTKELKEIETQFLNQVEHLQELIKEIQLLEKFLKEEGLTIKEVENRKEAFMITTSIADDDRMDDNAFRKARKIRDRMHKSFKFAGLNAHHGIIRFDKII